MRKFKNIEKSQRNLDIEGVTGTALGLPDGVKLQVLCMSDANPRWAQFGDDFSTEVRRLNRAGASEKMQKKFFDEWLPRLFVIGWDNAIDGETGEPIAFSLDECQDYFRQSDDAYLAVLETVKTTQNFRGGRAEFSKDALGK